MSIITEDYRDENSALHRSDGPARVCPDGSMFWYRHGKRHRRGGPARVCPDGTKFWYINDSILWFVKGHGLRAPEQLPSVAHPIMELFL